MLAGLHASPFSPQPGPRADFNMDPDWKFIAQDVPGADAPDFNDSTWQSVSLPHTWNDTKFREWISTRHEAKGEKHYYGFGWYRKHFTLDPAWAGRRVVIEFQGITLVAKFFVNGHAAGADENGVAPCGIDITSLVNFGADNVLAVQVDNNPNVKIAGYHNAKLPFGEPFNPNFGGLNRDVILHLAGPVHQTWPLYRNLGTSGAYIYQTQIDTLNRTATLHIDTEVANDSPAAQSVACNATVVDRDGAPVLTFAVPAQSIAAGARAVLKLQAPMARIHFWSPDFPYLYRVYTTLEMGGKPVDTLATSIGVRLFTFSVQHGLEVNGHPIYLKGYAPRTSMEWPCVGTPVDWMNEFDFQLIKVSNGNFVRPMHIAPKPVQVAAADKFGVIMVVPAANNEGDSREPDVWRERVDIMRDATIYYRNNPSVLFYEGCNQKLSAAHMRDMKNVRLTWDPCGGRLAGLRSNDNDSTAGIREYSCTMDGASSQPATPLWDAEYGRGEAPRRVWDAYTPILNPRWDGRNPDPTPADGLNTLNTTSKYVTGGYFAVASDYHRQLGFNSGRGDFIGDYIRDGKLDFAYFRLQSSEDMVLENLAKYFARYARSPFVQNPALSKAEGVMIGGAKIIWSDSVTDGRMRDTEVARVSGAVDGARLPKEVFYGLQVAQSVQPALRVIGHWNYPPGTVKRVYVVSNTAKVKLEVLDPAGHLIRDYGFGRNDFAAPANDQINHYCFAFDNVAFQPGIIRATGYDSGGESVATEQKVTAGPPAAIRLTPALGPSGRFYADGSDIAMFDVEVIDAKGNRCPAFEDRVDFACSGQGTFLGGYNSGIRYSTNAQHLTAGYHLNVECGINRVFVRATRNAGSFTLTASRPGLAAATQTIASSPVTVTGGLMAAMPQAYTVALGPEPAPAPSHADAAATAAAPPASNALIVDFAYSGAHSDAEVAANATPQSKVYMDTGATFGGMPPFLAGATYVRPYQGDAGETSSTDQYQFDLARQAYVYLLIDAANDMPANNDNAAYRWQKLPGTVKINGRPMAIFKSRLMQPGDNVYLAANGHGVHRFDPRSNMYLVLVSPAP
ncbi:MAG TPA: DUF4982 domain-containing protein [Chthoniobacteraceae bacterium]|nr:DUF4982 domain-containing protein [Chthoniobacteraceae bacterium]